MIKVIVIIIVIIIIITIIFTINMIISRLIVRDHPVGYIMRRVWSINQHMRHPQSSSPSLSIAFAKLVLKPTREASSILITIIVCPFCQIDPVYGFLSFILASNGVRRSDVKYLNLKFFFSQKVKSLKPGRPKAPDQPRARYVLRRTRVNFAYSI